MKQYLTRTQTRFWSSEMPVGDPTGGAAYGERNEPVTAFMAVYGGYIAAAGAALSAVSAINQGQQAKDAAKYNAQLANNNAIAAQQQAAANAAAQSRKSRIQIGAMRAGYGAAGVGMEGSPMDVLEQSASMAELDRQNVLYGGAIRSQGYQSTAGLEMMRGDAAQTGSYFSAGSALLTGLGKASSSFGGESGNYAPVEDRNIRRVG